MNENPQHLVRKVLLFVVTGIAMVACGAGGFMMMLMFLMDLGTKRHDNYENYGQTPAVALVYLAGAVGFLVPGVVVWYLRRRRHS